MSEWRDPCPYRIVEDMGGAFALGLIGGTIFTTAKGAYTAPKGILNRWKGAYSNTRLRAGRYGSNFAAWGFVFSCSECAMIHLRQVEDPVNTITAGAVSGAVLAMRQGRGAMIISGFFGAFILAVMEGVMLVVNNYQLEAQLSAQKEYEKAIAARQRAMVDAGEVGRGWGGKNLEKDDGMVKAL